MSYFTVYEKIQKTYFNYKSGHLKKYVTHLKYDKRPMGHIAHLKTFPCNKEGPAIQEKKMKIEKFTDVRMDNKRSETNTFQL